MQARLLRSALRALRIWLDLCAWNYLALLRARAAHWVLDEFVLAVSLVPIVLFCAGGPGGSNAMAKIETGLDLRSACGAVHLARDVDVTPDEVHTIFGRPSAHSRLETLAPQVLLTNCLIMWSRLLSAPG